MESLFTDRLFSAERLNMLVLISTIKNRGKKMARESKLLPKCLLSIVSGFRPSTFVGTESAGGSSVCLSAFL